jgi:hypothetical protein
MFPVTVRCFHLTAILPPFFRDSQVFPPDYTILPPFPVTVRCFHLTADSLLKSFSFASLCDYLCVSLRLMLIRFRHTFPVTVRYLHLTAILMLIPCDSQVFPPDCNTTAIVGVKAKRHQQRNLITVDKQMSY